MGSQTDSFTNQNNSANFTGSTSDEGLSSVKLHAISLGLYSDWFPVNFEDFSIILLFRSPSGNRSSQ